MVDNNDDVDSKDREDNNNYYNQNYAIIQQQPQLQYNTKNNIQPYNNNHRVYHPQPYTTFDERYNPTASEHTSDQERLYDDASDVEI